MSSPVIIGDATLYLGDARELLPLIGSVNMVCTDVPYELESGGRSGLMGGKFDPTVYDNSGEFIPCDIEFDEFMPLIADVLPQGHAYFMVNNRHVAGIENAALAAGFRFHNWLVWDKGTCTPNRWYMKNCEFTLLAFRGQGRLINDCGSRQLIRCPNVIGGVHDTQKPVALMEHYISNSSDRGDIVLDPFMGSGTTGVAALNLGRKFIGIEKDEQHFSNAIYRIENETRQQALFGEAA
jgi:site-specific DNA-methyltransferase (adenine-specific)